MQDTDNLLRTTVAELDRLLDARHVLGAPIRHGDVTVIPFVSYGFGFGAGGAAAGGAGAGGGIRPLGAIVIDGNGARVEAIRAGAAGVAATLAEAAVRALDALAARKDGAGPGA